MILSELYARDRRTNRWGCKMQHLMQRPMEGHIVNILKDTYRHTDTQIRSLTSYPWPSGCMVTLAYCCCHPQHRQTDGLHCQHRDHDVCSSNNIKIIITTVTRNTDCLLSLVKYTDNCTGPVITNKLTNEWRSHMAWCTVIHYECCWAECVTIRRRHRLRWWRVIVSSHRW